MKSLTRRRGFTLIELLIVVAIIGILAAIAIPNFLNAQIRAKVSRVKAELRTIGTAMELYFTDNGDYPFPEPRNQQYYWEYHNGLWRKRITTPIAYISSLPPDPFKPPDAYRQIQYYLQTYYMCGVDTGGPEPGRFQVNTYSTIGTSIRPGQYQGHVRWAANSWGPIGRSAYEVYSDGLVGYELYDPTNGTVSVGTIDIWGPGVLPHETWD